MTVTNGDTQEKILRWKGDVHLGWMRKVEEGRGRQSDINRGAKIENLGTEIEKDREGEGTNRIRGNQVCFVLDFLRRYLSRLASATAITLGSRRV